ncbi:MAG: YncE family protein, partial [Methanosarcina sp.]|nr:YncE family protein [Methanosarcina sp.]
TTSEEDSMKESNNSNNSDSESDTEDKPSKNNSTPGFGLLGSLTCLYGGWKLRKK